MNEALRSLATLPVISPYSLALSRQARAALKGQRPRCLWLTGLSGAGKSTLANSLDLHLHQFGLHTFLLDGDNVRNGLCRDLGMDDAGLIVIVAAISPFRAERDAARQLFAEGDFIEVHVSTSLKECERRDPKGLYQAVRQGRIQHFTGIDSPYEAPLAAECRIDTQALELSEACERLATFLLKK